MQLRLDSVRRCAAAWQRERRAHGAESARAAAISAPLRRAQFLAGRWLAAELLARHCGGQPDEWQISCASGEAPRVVAGPRSGRPLLSIAHRGDAVACALADVPLGVDIEVEGQLLGATDERAEFVLSPGEHADFAQTAAAQRESFLLARWTLKEAWAKRSGQGLALGDLCGLATRAMPGGGGNARLWSAHGLVVALCAGPAGEWPQPRGLGFEPVSPQRWQVEPVSRRR